MPLLVPLNAAPWIVFVNGASASMQYFVSPLNESKYCLKYTFKAVHALGIMDPGTPLMPLICAKCVHIQIKEDCAAPQESKKRQWNSRKEDLLSAKYKIHFKWPGWKEGGVWWRVRGSKQWERKRLRVRERESVRGEGQKAFCPYRLFTMTHAVTYS